MIWILSILFVIFVIYTIRRLKAIESAIGDSVEQINKRIDSSNEASNDNFKKLHNSSRILFDRTNKTDARLHKLNTELDKLTENQRRINVRTSR